MPFALYGAYCGSSMCLMLCLAVPKACFQRSRAQQGTASSTRTLAIHAFLCRTDRQEGGREVFYVLDAVPCCAEGLLPAKQGTARHSKACFQRSSPKRLLPAKQASATHSQEKAKKPLVFVLYADVWSGPESEV